MGTFNGGTTIAGYEALHRGNINTSNYYVTTNSGNAYSVQIPEISTLVDGTHLYIKFNAASTGAVSLNINGGTAIPVLDFFKNAVTNVSANLPTHLIYESSSNSFILLGKGGGGNALPTDIRQGKTATKYTGLITGTSLVQATSAQTVTPTISNIVKPAGIYDGNITISGDANLVTANIKAGTSIFGVSGKSSVVETSDANVLASQIRNGQTAYVNGAKVTGTNPVQATGAQTIIPGTVDIVKPAGIYDGNITVKAGYALNSTINEQNLQLYTKNAVSKLSCQRCTIDKQRNIYITPSLYNTIVKYNSSYVQQWSINVQDSWSSVTDIIINELSYNYVDNTIVAFCNYYYNSVENYRILIFDANTGAYKSYIPWSYDFVSKPQCYGGKIIVNYNTSLYVDNPNGSEFLIFALNSVPQDMDVKNNTIACCCADKTIKIINILTRTMISIPTSIPNSMYIALDNLENVYVLDVSNDVLYKYDNLGNLLWNTSVANSSGIPIGLNGFVICAPYALDLDGNIICSTLPSGNGSDRFISSDLVKIGSYVYAIYDSYKVTVIS